MENNNAVAAQGPDDEAKVDLDEEPSSRDRGSRQRRQPYNREIRPEDETGKWAIRRKIWDYLEDNNLVNAPRPCHYRIPNFEGAALANDKLANLEVFKLAKTVKVNPDKPQEQARFLVLQAGKDLVLLNQSQRYLLTSSSSHKQSGLLVQVVPPEGADKEKLRHCCTSQGVKEFSTEIETEEKVTIDLLVVGSVAVSRNGYRIGKGKGFADLEYAMMRTLGAIDADTVVVTSVHDSQIVDIPEDLVGEHDLTVDYILTPTEVIDTRNNRPKPKGVEWSHLEVNKFFQIPVLKQLRDLEQKAGSNVLLKGQENEDDDPLENAEPPRPRRFRRFGRGGSSYRGRGRPFRRGGGGGGSRRRTEGDRDDGIRENVETGDESGADGDNDGRGRRRNFRNRRFNSRGKPRSYESEHSDGGGDSGQGDGDDKGIQRRYPSRRRFQRRRRYEGGSRRDNRGGGDHSGSDGEQKTSGDEEGEVRRPQRQRFRTNPDTIVWVGGLSRRLRVSELKTELRALHVNPLRLVWRGARGFAFIHFQSTDSAKEAVNVLSGKELDGKEIKVEMANNDRPPRRRGGDYHGSSKEDNPSSDQVEAGDR
jgi:5-formyltetrahydrofolate cyclo-ligase